MSEKTPTTWAIDRRSFVRRAGLGVALLAATPLALADLLPGGSARVLRRRRRPAMGSAARIVALHDDGAAADAAIDAAFAELERVERAMSIFRADSELVRVNRSTVRGAAAPCSAELFGLLERAQELMRLTEGAVDPTLLGLVNAWGFGAAGSGSSAARQQLARARAAVGRDALELDRRGGRVRLAGPEAGLDLGGIAKGYGVDRALETLRARGAVAGLVEAGGDVRVYGGEHLPEKGWRIGVADPTGAARIVDILSLRRGAVATSGSFDKVREIGGKRVSHLIDPRSGEPLPAAPHSTLVRAGDATTADALATAMHIEPKLIERARELGASAVVVGGAETVG